MASNDCPYGRLDRQINLVCFLKRCSQPTLQVSWRFEVFNWPSAMRRVRNRENRISTYDERLDARQRSINQINRLFFKIKRTYSGMTQLLVHKMLDR